MTTEKNPIHAPSEGMEDPVLQAEQAEARAKAEPDEGSYTHVFKKPFQWNGRSYDRLTFDWEALTGADYINLEEELLRKGKTVILPEFTSSFLIGMARSCCTEKDESGRRVLDHFAFQALPLQDFKAICGKARNFLLRSA